VTELHYRLRPRRPPARRGRGALRVALGLLALAVAFVLGVALGKSLGDSPHSGGTQTLVRTLQPLPQRPDR
jgi:hypothetical protein